MTLKQYIEENLPKTIRCVTEDIPPRFGLPYPFIVPSVSDMFQEMYYWDSYFAGAGLILCGQAQQAKYNTDNLLSMIDRFGFVLNGSRDCFLYNSQPPFLSMMMREVYEVFPDKEWLAVAYPKLKKEYEFWHTRRLCDCGLYRYDAEPMPPEEIKGASEALLSRLGYRPEGLTDYDLARGLHAAGESGWDCTPRMQYEGYNYAASDLNCLLYAMTDNLSYFAAELGLAEESAAWGTARDDLAKRMRALLKDADGVFLDYYLPTETLSTVRSCACFFPLYVGLATPEEAAAAVSKVLPVIETDYGVVSCEPCDIAGVFQWGYPNGWAPLHRVVVDGLLRYGYREEGLRVAAKFADTVERTFAETGHLWEKYNMEKGNIEVRNEYDMPAMLGWTFSTYVCCCHLLGREIR